jgi:hypothetical protein
VTKPKTSPEPVKDAVRVKQAISQKVKNQELACTAAFEIISELGESPKAVGQILDEMKIKIVHCQLGLFGYLPNKKIVAAEKNVDPQLKAAVESAADNGRLTCSTAWNIAAKLKIQKLEVSNAVEGSGMKIKPCQLGAF